MRWRRLLAAAGLLGAACGSPCMPFSRLPADTVCASDAGLLRVEAQASTGITNFACSVEVDGGSLFVLMSGSECPAAPGGGTVVAADCSTAGLPDGTYALSLFIGAMRVDLPLNASDAGRVASCR
jgi:hypothetical protein